MCQIIAIKTTLEDAPAILDHENFGKQLEEILKSKGGDYFSFVINDPVKQEFHWFKETPAQCPKAHDYINKLFSTNAYNQELNFLFFSRQKPEMESDTSEEQPYVSLKDAGVIAVHGTIYNDKEIAQLFQKEIDIDTEVFKFINFDSKNILGTFAAIKITPDGKIYLRDNGLKIWESKITLNDKFLGRMFATTEMTLKDNSFKNIEIIDNFVDHSKILIASFSTGMDISLSVFKALSDAEKYSKLELIYFAWGSRAENEEIAKLKQFANFYQTHFNIRTEYKILKAKDYFKDYFEITGAPLPKIALAESNGIETETEAPIAYVPFRNTMFITTLAAYAEAKNYRNVDLIFGLNLSEGMVYMDNSEGWLSAVNQMVKYGGKDPYITGTYKVIAPYFARTKSNMLKEFAEEFDFAILKQLLDLSFSCYYPTEDGSPCGKCGSCILRKKAILNLY
jgi:7-cyano-7-deazaguanine synthase in queuosine biosynthesis